MKLNLPRFNMFVHSACCMKHWYLSNPSTENQVLICMQCSKTAGVKIQVLSNAKLGHLTVEGKVVPGIFVSECCNRAFELVYQRTGRYKLVCEECNQDILDVKVTGPKMTHCAACGRARR